MALVYSSSDCAVRLAPPGGPLREAVWTVEELRVALKISSEPVVLCEPGCTAALSRAWEVIEKHVGWKEEVTPTSVNWHMTRLCNYSCKFCRTIDRVTDSVNSVFASRGGHLLSALSVTSFQSCTYLASVYTCVFAYNQSGTGKSITIVSLMSTPSEQSLLPRLPNDIFAAYDQMRSEGAEVNCKLEMIALYNEQIRDLLAQTQME